MLRSACAALFGLLVLTGCSGTTPNEPAQGAGQSSEQSSGQRAGNSDQMFPDVVDVVATRSEDGSYAFDVTMSSPYDTPQRYADGWRVMNEDGTVYGEMTLGHDHASEQPFTRTQTGVQIPQDVTTVVVEGRDQVNGYGGQTKSVDLPTG